MSHLESLKHTLNETHDLLDLCFFLQSKCKVIRKYILAVSDILEVPEVLETRSPQLGFTSLTPTSFNHDVVNALKREPELVFLIIEALKRLKLFLITFLMHDYHSLESKKDKEKEAETASQEKEKDGTKPKDKTKENGDDVEKETPRTLGKEGGKQDSEATLIPKQQDLKAKKRRNKHKSRKGLLGVNGLKGLRKLDSISMQLMREKETKPPTEVIDREIVAYLKKTWVLLNYSLVQKDLCKKVKEVFSLTGKLVPKQDRKDFEANYKKYVSQSISRSVVCKTYKKLTRDLSKHAVDGIEFNVFGALQKFFLELEAKSSKNKKKEKGNGEVEKSKSLFFSEVNMSHPKYKADESSLVSFISGDLLALKAGIEVEILNHSDFKLFYTDDITQCKVNVDMKALDAGTFGEVTFGTIGPAKSFDSNLVNQTKGPGQRRQLQSVNHGHSRSAVSINGTKTRRGQMTDSSTSHYASATSALFQLLTELDYIRKLRDRGDVLMFPKGVFVSHNLNFYGMKLSLVYADVKMNLDSILCNNKTQTLYDFTDFEALCIMSSLMQALEALHSAGFVHNNLNPKTIFFCFANSRKGPKSLSESSFSMRGALKLGNFGVVSSSVLPGMMNGAGEDKKQRDLDFLGDFMYNSPETILSCDNLAANDMYALAMVSWRLLHYKKDPISSLLSSASANNRKRSILPTYFSENNNLFILSRDQMMKKISKSVMRGYRPSLDYESRGTASSSVLRETLLNVVRKCWHEDACRRPEAKELREQFEGIYVQEKKHFQKDSEGIQEIIGGIMSNLRNGENYALKHQEGMADVQSVVPITPPRRLDHRKSVGMKSISSAFTAASSFGQGKRSTRHGGKNLMKSGKNGMEKVVNLFSSAAFRKNQKKNSNEEKVQKLSTTSGTNSEDLPINPVGLMPPSQQKLVKNNDAGSTISSTLMRRIKSEKKNRNAIRSSVSRLASNSTKVAMMFRQKTELSVEISSVDFETIERQDSDEFIDANLDHTLFEETVSHIDDASSVGDFDFDDDDDEDDEDYGYEEERFALNNIRLQGGKYDSSFRFNNRR